MQPGEEYRLEGAVNFRELGGYRAADGRTVRWGQLYRGGALADLHSPSDTAFLQGLGLKTVLDLRSAGEAADAPDPSLPGCAYYRSCALRFPDGGEMDFSPTGIQDIDAAKRELEARLGRPVHDFEWFSDLYAAMPFQNPAYQLLFRLLEQHQTPMLFHCSAGKDRTGIGAILLLLALGVSDGDALQDYMLTNVYRKAQIDAFLAKVPPEQHDLLLSVEGVSRAMAEGPLHAILRRYNSYEAYFEAEFGLDAPRLQALRDWYLE